MKKIIIECLVSSQKTAVLEDDKLVELLIEDNKNLKKVSNIYRGVVKKVIPGIQACFVDIGFEKLAYLQLNKDSDINFNRCPVEEEEQDKIYYTDGFLIQYEHGSMKDIKEYIADIWKEAKKEFNIK